MEHANPYQSPQSEITPPSEGIDTSSPFSPSGRFTRLSYLAWGMVVTVAMYALVILLLVTGIVAAETFTSGDPFAPYQSIPLVVLYLAMLVVFFLFAIRRLHDFDASGWWSALILVPLANVVLGLMLIFKAGTEGANRFAPPRPTPGWERVVGIIAAVLIGLAIALSIISIVIAIFVASQQVPVQ